MSYLRYLCLIANNGVLFVLFVFALCLVYPMLSFSLDCSLFFIAPSVFSKHYLSGIIEENVSLRSAY